MTRPRIALALIACIAVACTSSGPTTVRSLSPTPAVNATEAPLLPVMADALPAFDVAAYTNLLTQLRGTPVVVNFWGAWCYDCRLEAPILRDAAERYGGRVQFLGIDTQDNLADAVPFIRGAGWTYPNLFDPGGVIQTSLGLQGDPNTVFYAASGQEVGRVNGPVTQDLLLNQVRKLLE